MKIPISIEQDSLQYCTSVLIDPTLILKFARQDFLIRNNLLGKYTRGSKIDVQIANEQRISTSQKNSPTNVSLGQKMFTSLSFIVLPHFKCMDFIFGLPAMKELNMYIKPLNILMLIGDIHFSCDSKKK